MSITASQLGNISPVGIVALTGWNTGIDSLQSRISGNTLVAGQEYSVPDTYNTIVGTLFVFATGTNTIAERAIFNQSSLSTEYDSVLVDQTQASANNAIFYREDKLGNRIYGSANVGGFIWGNTIYKNNYVDINSTLTFSTTTNVSTSFENNYFINSTVLIETGISTFKTNSFTSCFNVKIKDWTNFSNNDIEAIGLSTNANFSTIYGKAGGASSIFVQNTIKNNSNNAIAQDEGYFVYDASSANSTTFIKNTIINCSKTIKFKIDTGGGGVIRENIFDNLKGENFGSTVKMIIYSVGTNAFENNIVKGMDFSSSTFLDNQLFKIVSGHAGAVIKGNEFNNDGFEFGGSFPATGLFYGTNQAFEGNSFIKSIIENAFATPVNREVLQNFVVNGTIDFGNNSSTDSFDFNNVTSSVIRLNDVNLSSAGGFSQSSISSTHIELNTAFDSILSMANVTITNYSSNASLTLDDTYFSGTTLNLPATAYDFIGLVSFNTTSTHTINVISNFSATFTSGSLLKNIMFINDGANDITFHPVGVNTIVGGDDGKIVLQSLSDLVLVSTKGSFLSLSASFINTAATVARQVIASVLA